MSTENSFIPQGYEVPKGNSAYLKFQDGENKFRVLSAPIMGWVDWKDKKPLRFPMDKKPAAPVDPTKPIKHFWAFVVWDYVGKKIAILEITQAGVMTAIKNLSEDKDWGAPFGYDIKVTKSGAGMETKYAINPVPHKEVHKMIADLYKETPINLYALFEGKDPFEVAANNTTVNTAAPVGAVDSDDDDLPF